MTEAYYLGISTYVKPVQFFKKYFFMTHFKKNKKNIIFVALLIE